MWFWRKEISMEQIILIGTSGLAKEIVNFIDRYHLFEVIGFTVNHAYIKDNEYMGKPVYPIEELENYFSANEVKLFSTVSWYNYLNRVRKQKFDELKAKGYSFANLISPHAMIYDSPKNIGNTY